MRAAWTSIGLAALLGWCCGALESVLVVLLAGTRVIHPIAEPAGVAAGYAVAAAVLASLWLGAGRLRGRPSASAAVAFAGALLLFVLAGDWLHEQALADAGFLAPVSLATTAGLALAAGGIAVLLGRAARRRPGRLGAGLAVVALAAHGVLWLAERPAAQQPPPAPPPAGTARDRPDIVFLLVDTLRADRLGCYGYEAPVSPTLDALAAAGSRFESATAQAPWTRASVASLFTSLYPGSHDTNNLFQRLPGALPTLAEGLHAAGYRTAAFSANVNVSPAFGFDQGFEHFWLHDTSSLARFTAGGRIREWLRGRLGASSPFEDLHGNDARTVNEEVYGWLDRVEAERAAGDRRPLFLYVQYIDPHFPYWPPEWLLDGPMPDAAGLHHRARIPHNPPPYPFGAWPEQEEDVVEGLQRLYDGEIRFVDREIGWLLERLRADGILDEDALVVVTSDHGEEFLEHGQGGHGQSLFQELIHVPLILRGRGVPAGRVVAEPVELVDLLPTLLRAAGVEPPAAIHGHDLSPLLAGQASPHLVLSEKLSFSPLVGLRDGRWKVIRVRHDGEERWLLYDLEADPGEQHDLSGTETGTLQRLRQALETAEQRAASLKQASAERVEIDDATYETLRSLGYIGGD